MLGQMFRHAYQSGVISILSAQGSDPLQLWDVCSDGQSGDGCSSRIRRISSDNCNYSEDSDNPNKVAGPVVELSGERLSQNYIVCPPKPHTLRERPALGIKLRYLYLVVYVPDQCNFSFEVAVLDDKQTIRRFRSSTYQSTAVIKPDICVMPLRLEKQRGRLARDALLLPAKKEKVDGDYSSHDNSSGYYGPRNDDEDDGEDEYDTDEDKVPCWNRLCVPLADYTKRAYGTNYVETVRVQIHANCLLKRVYFAERELDEDDELPEEFRLYQRAS